jgi:hypothetical protein
MGTVTFTNRSIADVVESSGTTMATASARTVKSAVLSFRGNDILKPPL